MSLFQTEAWQRAWWRVWGKTPGFELKSGIDGGRSGLYTHRYALASLFPVTCLQFVGSNYRKLSTPRTEYNALVAPGSDNAKAIASLGHYHWSEAVFSDLPENAIDLKLLRERAMESGWYVRSLSTDTAYSVNTTGSFDDYLEHLGKNTRLKLFNRRNVFESLGKTSETNYWPDRATTFFDILNKFHKERWGCHCFNEQSISFHLNFLNDAVDEGVTPLLMVLEQDDRPVSLQYNAIYQGRMYNIQSGFRERFHKKISLGTLHFGYAIESAFLSTSVGVFDFLAGEGKKTDYKKHLATDAINLVSVMIVRNPIYKLLYKIKDLQY